MLRCTALLGLAVVSTTAFAQSLIITAEGKHGQNPPRLAKDDIQVQIDHKPARIENWTLLRGSQASVELYIVVDDGTVCVA